MTFVNFRIVLGDKNGEFHHLSKGSVYATINIGLRLMGQQLSIRYRN